MSRLYAAHPAGFRVRASRGRCGLVGANCWPFRRTRSTPTFRSPSWGSRRAMRSLRCSPRSQPSRTRAFLVTSRRGRSCARRATICASAKSCSSWRSACSPARTAGALANVRLAPLRRRARLHLSDLGAARDPAAFLRPGSHGSASQNGSSGPSPCSLSSITGPKRGSVCCTPTARGSTA